MNARMNAQRRRMLAAGGIALFAAPLPGRAQWWSYLRAPRTMVEVSELLDTRFPDVPRLTTAALADELARGDSPLLLDVREQAEFDVSHLPGALHAPNATTALRLAASLAPGSRIVTYCSIGYRSASVARALSEAGHVNVVNLDGSIFKWANEGRPIVRDSLVEAAASAGKDADPRAGANGAPAGKTTAARTVHPYDAQWGQLLDAPLRAPLAPSGQP